MFTFGPADLEVHRGLDGRYYLIDPARLFPPLKPKESAARSGQNLYRHFRPEFFLSTSWKKPLSSDAYSKFQSSDEERRNNVDVQDATNFLIRKVIPEFAREMDRFYRALYTPLPVSSPTQQRQLLEGSTNRGDDENLEIELNSVMANRFLVQMHLRGINAEFMGRVYEEVKFVPLKRFLLLELVSRTMKGDVQSWLREQSATRLKGMICGASGHEMEMKKWIAERMTHYFRSGSEENEDVWQKLHQQLKTQIHHRFDSTDLCHDDLFAALQHRNFCGRQDKDKLNHSSSSSTTTSSPPEVSEESKEKKKEKGMKDLYQVFLRVQSLVGFSLKCDFAFFSDDDHNKPFEPSDVVELFPKVKSPYAFSYVLAYALFEKAQTETCRAEAQTIYLRASEQYEKALSSYPGDWIAFCNHSATLTQLALLENDLTKSRELLIWADLQAFHSCRLNKAGSRMGRTLSNWAVVLNTMSSRFPEFGERLCDLALMKLCLALDQDFWDASSHQNMGLVLSQKGALISNVSLKDIVFQEARWHLDCAISEATSKGDWALLVSAYENLSTVMLRYAYTLRSLRRLDQAIRLCLEIRQRLQTHMLVTEESVAREIGGGGGGAVKVGQLLRRSPLILHNMGESLMLEAGMVDAKDEGESQPLVHRLLTDAASFFDRCASTASEDFLTNDPPLAHHAREKTKKIKAILGL